MRCRSAKGLAEHRGLLQSCLVTTAQAHLRGLLGVSSSLLLLVHLENLGQQGFTNATVFVTNIVEVLEGVVHGLEIGHGVVVQTMLLAQSLDTGRGLGLTELRHVGEQVVLDLEVQVAHDPVDKDVVGNVDSAQNSRANPVLLLLMKQNLLVSVAQSEVGKQVRASNGAPDQVRKDHAADALEDESLVPDVVVEDQEDTIHPSFLAEDGNRVQIQLPEQHHKPCGKLKGPSLYKKRKDGQKRCKDTERTIETEKTEQKNVGAMETRRGAIQSED